ncbi:exodeoxyribonuclease VII small subunit [Parapedobacter indicus]|uniref:Exodeoxyribonuclease VII small subunit n=1 Tax=Parapedobacter indicus TaxID=1477437 RepID=A0A1I3KZY8_9SPHI|nr:exodeoxyribonuclease VII small subunit [Parapedobacter indicus]PPL01973.1 exodeoxyribonuclease VII small subunit [Parapedobacter indicus]SFI77980.1 Exodeoxyribonuclease VII small subunit [Parapedobacter indicus]
MSKQYTYTDAFEELQTIVSEIEHGDISIDELSEKVKRATLLIGVCKAKLTATEGEVNNILANLDKEADRPEGETD